MWSWTAVWRHVLGYKDLSSTVTECGVGSVFGVG